MASFAVLAFWKVLQPGLGNTSQSTLLYTVARKVECGDTVRTLQDEYTPSFSSFLGRGEERSCAFFTAIRADPPAAPEPSVLPAPPVPGAAGAEPAAPTAGEPCWKPALSAMVSPAKTEGPAQCRSDLVSALVHQRRIRHGAHPYFQFLIVGPFSSARGVG